MLNARHCEKGKLARPGHFEVFSMRARKNGTLLLKKRDCETREIRQKCFETHGFTGTKCESHRVSYFRDGFSSTFSHPFFFPLMRATEIGDRWILDAANELFLHALFVKLKLSVY